MYQRSTLLGGLGSLPVLIGLLLGSSIAYVPLSHGSVIADVPEVVLPFALSLGLIAWTVRHRRQTRGTGRIERMARYGWAGALLSAAVGLVWIALYLHYGLSVGGLSDQLLTVLSVGVAGGVLVGSHVTREQRADGRIDRDRVLAQAAWTDRDGSNPISLTVVEQLVELEGVEPADLSPLYEYVDPAVLAGLQSRTDAPWRLTLSIEGYEVVVASHGTVTVYEGRSTGEASATAA